MIRGRKKHGLAAHRFDCVATIMLPGKENSGGRRYGCWSQNSYPNSTVRGNEVLGLCRVSMAPLLSLSPNRAPANWCSAQPFEYCLAHRPNGSHSISVSTDFSAVKMLSAKCSIFDCRSTPSTWDLVISAIEGNKMLNESIQWNSFRVDCVPTNRMHQSPWFDCWTNPTGLTQSMATASWMALLIEHCSAILNYGNGFVIKALTIRSSNSRHQYIPNVCNGVFMPRNAKRCTRLISPDEMTSPCRETFSKILVSLRKVTFFKVQSSNDTEYLDALRPRANCSSPWMSPLQRKVCGISHPHSKNRLFSLMFGHFQSVKSGSSSSFRFREFALLYALLPPPFVARFVL